MVSKSLNRNFMHIDSINDSFFDSTSSYAIVESTSQYEIAESTYFWQFNIHIYLIQDRYTGKYNMYVLDDKVNKWPGYLDFIVDCFQPLGLELAMFCFPQYSFSMDTYGF